MLFDMGAAFLEWARTFEPRCRERIADRLLDLYNNVWADDDPEEGPPPLSRAQFLTAIHPAVITLDAGGSSSWIYAYGNLFAGHGIWLMLDAGRSFSGDASLVG